jgi:hypothetical protein
LHAVGPEAVAAGAAEHATLVLDPADKVAVAAELAGRPSRTLFFVRTKHGAGRLARQLERVHGLGDAALQERGLWGSGYLQPVVYKAGGQPAVSHGNRHPFQRVCANVAGGEDARLAGLQRVGVAA